MDILEIQKILPHRYPFLLIDRVVELNTGKSAVAIKNVTFNEPFFQGHFPNQPVMPGVLISEALAQVAGICLLTMDEHKGKIPYYGGIDKMRFKKKVIPGDVLKLEVEVITMRRNIAKVKGVAKVDGKVAAIGEMTFSVGN